MLSLFPTYYVYLGGTFFPLLVVPSRTFFSGGGGGGGACAPSAPTCICTWLIVVIRGLVMSVGGRGLEMSVRAREG